MHADFCLTYKTKQIKHWNSWNRDFKEFGSNAIHNLSTIQRSTDSQTADSLLLFWVLSWTENGNFGTIYPEQWVDFRRYCGIH